MALGWAKICLQGLIRELLKKCKKAIGTLEWEEEKRYFGTPQFTGLLGSAIKGSTQKASFE